MSLKFTGIADDDRRIAAELQAMGAFDTPEMEQASTFAQVLVSISDFVEWTRWKGEVAVYGCRVGAASARRQEAKHFA
jgi:hypothetical protein